MRLIDRTGIAVPTILQSRAAEAYRRAIHIYLSEKHPDTRPPEPPPSILEDKDLRLKLEDLFGGACAYCETPTEAFEGVVEHFRPPGGAERTDGRIDFRHYSWLAVEWANLYHACHACSRSKANRFPVRKVGAVGANIERINAMEGMLLLDPCRDRPVVHFHVSPDGELRGRTPRGWETITVLRLNRPDLLRARAQVMANVATLMRPEGHADVMPIVDHLFSGRSGFVGIALIALLQELSANHPLQALRERPIDSEAIDQIAEAARSGRLTASKRRRRPPRPPRIDRPTPPPEQARYVRSLHIRNFRGIASAAIVFPEQSKRSASKVGSIVILGENGVGKSSILQALALGALGAQKVGDLGLTPSWCLRDGEREGEIEVRYFDTDRSNVLRFSKDMKECEGEENVPTVVLGYGAYRLPARGPVSGDKAGYDYRVHSLFDERKLVNGPFGLHQHLRRDGKVDEDRLEDAMRTLNSLLLGEARASIGERAQLTIEDRGRRQSLSELSSGYRSIVTIASDIMDVLYKLWQGITSGQALVLIDEIDAHLHPEWRLKVVDALRAAFPATQFLMTTHDPLVLRGLARDEVLVMTRDAEGNAELEAPRIPELDELSIDQMLTSQLFGLETTMDAKLARDLSRYYELVSKQERSPDEQDELLLLRQTLPDQQPSGGTRRERLMYAMIDRFLARPDTARTVDAWDADAVGTLLADLEIAEREALADDLSPP